MKDQKEYDLEASHALNTLISMKTDKEIDIPAISKLLKMGANPNVCMPDGTTLLLYCMHEIIADCCSQIQPYQFYVFLLNKVPIKNLHHILTNFRNTTNPLMELMLILIKQGADPNTFCTEFSESVKFDDMDYACHFRITPLGLALLLKPDAVIFLLKAGAIPLSKQHPSYKHSGYLCKDITYDPAVIALLPIWLSERETLDYESTKILASYKEDLLNSGLVNRKNYRKALHPETAAGKVLWFQRGDYPCSLYSGVLKNILKILVKAPEAIASELNQKDVVIDPKTGCWKPKTIITLAEQTFINIERNHHNAFFFDKPASTELAMLEKIGKTLQTENPREENILQTFSEATALQDSSSFFKNAVSQFILAATPLYLQHVQQIRQNLEQTCDMQENALLLHSQSFFNLFLKNGAGTMDLIVYIFTCLEIAPLAKLREISREFKNIVDTLSNALKFEERKKAWQERPKDVPFYCKRANKQITIYTKICSTVLDLKKKIGEAEGGIPAEQLCLYHKGKPLLEISSKRTLADHKIPAESTLTYILAKRL